MTPGVPKHLPRDDVHMIASQHVQQTFKLQVMQPLQMRGESTKFPVVYATDGNFTFEALKAISYSLQLAGLAERFILVGIGYPGASPLAGARLRWRDLTFPPYPILAPDTSEIDEVDVPEKSGNQFYGAGDFHKFLRSEVIPLIDSSYPTRVGDRTYFGHSLGASFGLFSLCSEPSLFANYIISSPKLSFRREANAVIGSEEFLRPHLLNLMHSSESLRGVRIFMSVGTNEEYDPALLPWRLVRSFDHLVSLFRQNPRFEFSLTANKLAGETHATAWPIAFAHGIRTMFAPTARRLDPEQLRESIGGYF